MNGSLQSSAFSLTALLSNPRLAAIFCRNPVLHDLVSRPFFLDSRERLSFGKKEAAVKGCHSNQAELRARKINPCFAILKLSQSNIQ